MTMRIDRNKLQAKYSLEVYKMVDGYPSTIDLLYEITTILQERDKLTDAFAAKDLLKEVSTRLNVGEDLEISLHTMVKEGWLKEENGQFFLLKHPWF